MKLKTWCLLLGIAGALPFASFSQTSVYHRYIIEFTDKNNSPFSISNPSQYLSQRSIDRRNRYGIQITINDLPVNPDYINQVLNTGVTLLNRSKWLNSISIETEDSLALVAIKALPFVKSSNPIAPRYAGVARIHKNVSATYATKAEADNLFDYGHAANQIEMLHGNVLHEEGFRGEGMVIAVLDVGFVNAPNLQVFDSIFDDHRVLGWWNFVKRNDSVFYEGTHGSSVLSTIVGNIPGQLIGTAPKASVYLFVTEDGSSEYPIEEHNWAAAAERADSLGADMITTSLGYTQFDDPSFNHLHSDLDGNTTMVTRAADFAASKGMIVSCSAGNEGNHEWYYIVAPADADSVITVGAVDSIGINTSFSSHGPAADGDIKPTVVAQGIRTTLVEPYSGTIVTSNGTSFSNPIIAGMTACLWQAHPEKNNMEIIEAIKKSASLYFDPNDSMGYGIPNYQVADLMLSDKAPDNLALTGALVYPNPFEESFGILYYTAREQEVNIEVFNVPGQRVQSLNTTFQIGYNYLPIELLKNAPNGLYFLRLNFEDHSDVTRVMKTSK